MKGNNLSLHYTRKYFNFENIRGHEREYKLKGLLKSTRLPQALFRKNVAESYGVVRVSYAIAKRISKNSILFSNGYFVKKSAYQLQLRMFALKRRRRKISLHETRLPEGWNNRLETKEKL